MRLTNSLWGKHWFENEASLTLWLSYGRPFLRCLLQNCIVTLSVSKQLDTALINNFRRQESERWRQILTACCRLWLVRSFRYNGVKALSFLSLTNIKSAIGLVVTTSAANESTANENRSWREIVAVYVLSLTSSALIFLAGTGEYSLQINTSLPLLHWRDIYTLSLSVHSYTSTVLHQLIWLYLHYCSCPSYLYIRYLYIQEKQTKRTTV